MESMKKYKAEDEIKEWFALTKRDIPMWLSVGFFIVGFLSRGNQLLIYSMSILSVIFCLIGAILLIPQKDNVSKMTNIYRVISGIMSIVICLGCIAFKLLFFMNKGLY